MPVPQPCLVYSATGAETLRPPNTPSLLFFKRGTNACRITRNRPQQRSRRPTRLFRPTLPFLHRPNAERIRSRETRLSHASGKPDGAHIDFRRHVRRRIRMVRNLARDVAIGHRIDAKPIDCLQSLARGVTEWLGQIVELLFCSPCAGKSPAANPRDLQKRIQKPGRRPVPWQPAWFHHSRNDHRSRPYAAPQTGFPPAPAKRRAWPD